MKDPEDILKELNIGIKRIGPLNLPVLVPKGVTPEGPAENPMDDLKSKLDEMQSGGPLPTSKTKGDVSKVILGENPEPDVDCEAALSEGLDPTTCKDFRGVRQYVMCLAWDLYKENGMPFGDAIQQAWNKAENQCPNL